MFEQKLFTNPTGNWTHKGPFRAHMRSDTNLDLIKGFGGIKILGNIITVGEDKNFPGRIKKVQDSIQLYAGSHPFFYVHEQRFYGHSCLINLYRPAGQLIWQNDWLKDKVMQQLCDYPHGVWPQFYYDGERVIGKIDNSKHWYQLNPGQEVHFNRHGTFKFSKGFRTLAHLDIRLPRKGWNPVACEHRLKLPINNLVRVRQNSYYVRPTHLLARDIPPEMEFHPRNRR